MAEYQNPQQQPGGEGRLLLIFLVTFLVMMAAQPFLKKYFPTPPPPKQQTQVAETPAPPPPPPPIATAEKATRGKPAKEVSKQAAAEEETVIENDLYRITFTNRGAQVKSWILKKFDNDTESGPLDLVNSAAAAQYGYPLSLWTYDEELRGKLNSALYVVSRDGGKITFEYSDHDLSVRKAFSFDDTYVAKVDTSVTNRGSYVPALPAWPSGFGDQTTPAFYAASLIDYQYNKNIERLPIKKISGGGTLPGPFHWAGPNDQYFAAIFIPDEPAVTSMVTLRHPLSIAKDASQKDSTEKINVEVLGAAVGNIHGPTSERVFVGPKELGVLEKVSIPGVSGADNDLNGLVDFGWWGIIAKPLFVWLKWTYRYIPNWGWAIVVQTIIISVVLLPLRITQMKSMLKMQRVAPQIKSIQEKYKKYSLR
ncbi:MAG: membrane protein insertase YidC, partial [Candidatus Sulfotelmatobacter sp.]